MSENSKTDAIQIIKIGPEDWQEVRDVYLKLLKFDPGAFVDEYDEVESRNEQDWRQSLEKSGATFIAKDNGKAVGMGRISFYDELPGVPVLHKLGVFPEYRGKGIARKLIKAREEWAKSQGAEKVRLYIIADREKTIEFSKNNGYKIVEVKDRVNQRKDGTWWGAVVMEKDLENEFKK